MKKLPFTVCAVVLCTLSHINAQNLYNPSYAELQTSSGYVRIGPTGTTYADFITDRSRFSFNKDLWVSTGVFSSYGSNMSLRTGANTRMTILSANGNVGIGTTSPLEKLHVQGHMLIPSNWTLKFGTEDPNTGRLRIGIPSCCYNTYFDYVGSIYFRKGDGAGGSTLGIQNDGTVTIGVWETYSNAVTPTDGHKLMVNGGILCEELKIIEDVPDADYVFEQDYQLMPIEELKSYVTTEKHLPNIPSCQEFDKNGYKVGDMDEMLLRKVEELTLYVIQLKEEVDALKLENAVLKKTESESGDNR